MIRIDRSTNGTGTILAKVKKKARETLPYRDYCEITRDEIWDGWARVHRNLIFPANIHHLTFPTPYRSGPSSIIYNLFDVPASRIDTWSFTVTFNPSSWRKVRRKNLTAPKPNLKPIIPRFFVSFSTNENQSLRFTTPPPLLLYALYRPTVSHRGLSKSLKLRPRFY